MIPNPMVVRSGPPPEAVVAHLGPVPGVAWLDGGSSAEGWSIIAMEPDRVLVDGEDWVRASRSLMSPQRGTVEAPFVGGLIGYLGFGAGHRTAPVPAGPPSAEPEIWLARYDGAMCYRHCDRSWHLTGPPALTDRFAELLAATPHPLAPIGEAPPPTSPPTSVSRGEYEQSVERILEWIHAGDCYQVNLSRVVHVGVDHPEDAGFSAYRRLRRFDAPYGAFLRLAPDLDIMCNSPELLLAKDGRLAVSEPIKGTRPRGRDPESDREQREALLTSDKDAAELTMIVDLVRNDLARISETGTVRAASRKLMSLPTVFHTYRRVEATLRRTVDAFDALTALFPPGSVTGAPKIRACRRIAELETEARGVYCGTIGYVSDHGQTTFNVAIRTGVVHRGEARYHVGGGVVASSEPAAEWDETQAKGAAWSSALGTPDQSSISKSS